MHTTQSNTHVSKKKKRKGKGKGKEKNKKGDQLNSTRLDSTQFHIRTQSFFNDCLGCVV